MKKPLYSEWFLYFNFLKITIKIAEAPLEAVNIVEYDPKSNGAADYRSFVEELLSKTYSK